MLHLRRQDAKDGGGGGADHVITLSNLTPHTYPSALGCGSFTTKLQDHGGQCFGVHSLLAQAHQDRQSVLVQPSVQKAGYVVED